MRGGWRLLLGASTHRGVVAGGPAALAARASSRAAAAALAAAARSDALRADASAACAAASAASRSARAAASTSSARSRARRSASAAAARWAAALRFASATSSSAGGELSTTSGDRSPHGPNARPRRAARTRVRVHADVLAGARAVDGGAVRPRPDRRRFGAPLLHLRSLHPARRILAVRRGDERVARHWGGSGRASRPRSQRGGRLASGDVSVRPAHVLPVAAPAPHGRVHYRGHRRVSEIPEYRRPGSGNTTQPSERCSTLDVRLLLSEEACPSLTPD